MATMRCTRWRVMTAGRAGQGVVEYGLILALTAALTALWLFVFGGAIADALTLIGEAIDRATGG
jgi:Flp pilus assembly pilin Flp